MTYLDKLDIDISITVTQWLLTMFTQADNIQNKTPYSFEKYINQIGFYSCASKQNYRKKYEKLK
ncbi:hypothetical protein IMG5_046980 [Ichthyophthirius multifiliis]|uniref:Uncharacterized protein n=1 Tax=Ichthyophthirius multifiliis TaxID=5932 RepID=G0QM95_ICHMU|nr:hypothetical protein IMG5_046980 [Ichthyophthirius multifiliis]EGR33652.1 hypothetical protein IMG5_046980 [Ichthyophthirius multifiliis]|eukprot:XP_004037638.1 hypothetical protein IMG5_046980 [Ichthyophthirius multifiliis]